MEKFIVVMTNKTTWEVEVEARDEEHAHEISFDWGRDELKEDEIIDNVWEIEIMGVE